MKKGWAIVACVVSLAVGFVAGGNSYRSVITPMHDKTRTERDEWRKGYESLDKREYERNRGLQLSPRYNPILKEYIP